MGKAARNKMQKKSTQQSAGNVEEQTAKEEDQRSSGCHNQAMESSMEENEAKLMERYEVMEAITAMFAPRSISFGTMHPTGEFLIHYDDPDLFEEDVVFDDVWQNKVKQMGGRAADNKKDPVFVQSQIMEKRYIYVNGKSHRFFVVEPVLKKPAISDMRQNGTEEIITPISLESPETSQQSSNETQDEQSTPSDEICRTNVSETAVFSGKKTGALTNCSESNSSDSEWDLRLASSFGTTIQREEATSTTHEEDKYQRPNKLDIRESLIQDNVRPSSRGLYAGATKAHQRGNCSQGENSSQALDTPQPILPWLSPRQPLSPIEQSSQPPSPSCLPGPSSRLASSSLQGSSARGSTSCLPGPSSRQPSSSLQESPQLRSSLSLPRYSPLQQSPSIQWPSHRGSPSCLSDPPRCFRCGTSASQSSLSDTSNQQLLSGPLHTRSSTPRVSPKSTSQAIAAAAASSPLSPSVYSYGTVRGYGYLDLYDIYRRIMTPEEADQARVQQENQEDTHQEDQNHDNA